MKISQQSLYDRSPVIVQNVATTVYGWKLARQRYGGAFDEYVRELEQSQYFSANDLQALQEERLRNLVQHCYRNVPYYEQLFNSLRLTPEDFKTAADLNKLPILSKQTIKEKPELFHARNLNDRIQKMATTGTTGTPLNFQADYESRRRNYAFFQRLKNWAGVGAKDRSATIAGRLIVPHAETKPPFWRYNLANRNVLFSSYHLADANLPSYLNKLHEYDPALIDSYPSSLYCLAEYALLHNSKGPHPKAVITSSETLLQYQRESIEKTFSTRIFDQYGAVEQVCFISQCEHGEYHVHPEFGITEFMPTEVPGECRIIATGFTNTAMPLLRYDTGDNAIPSTRECGCRRHFPIVDAVLGRDDDVIVTPAGKRVGRLSPVLKGFPAIRSAQMIQDAIDQITIKIVAAGAFARQDEEAVIAAMEQRLGKGIHYRFELVDKLPTGPGGKFRAVISMLPISARAGSDAKTQPSVHDEAPQLKEYAEKAALHKRSWFAQDMFSWTDPAMAFTMSQSAKLYAHSPLWLQRLGIYGFGWYWSRRRLGQMFQKTWREYSERDTWSADQIQSYVEERLREQVQRAYCEVPYYRAAFRQSGFTDESIKNFTIADLAKLPLLEKAFLRINPMALLTERAAQSPPQAFFTSGTTGTPIQVFWDHDVHQHNLAVREARSFRWAGVSLNDSRAMLGGRLIVPEAHSAPPFWRYNSWERQLYLSAFHISPTNVPDYVAAINRFQPDTICGYALGNFFLARMIAELGLEVHQPKAIITTSERMEPEMRKVLENVYRAPVFEECGSVENCFLATECTFGRLHMHSDFGYVEILNVDGSPSKPGEIGEIVASGFANTNQIFVRYRTGDRAAWSKEQQCPCGRPFPVISELVGRQEDMIITPDGREIGCFHRMFQNFPEAKEAQILQEALDHITIRVVPGAGYSETSSKELLRRVEARLGPQIRVEIVEVGSIAREKNGKFRMVKSLVKHRAGKPELISN